MPAIPSTTPMTPSCAPRSPPIRMSTCWPGAARRRRDRASAIRRSPEASSRAPTSRSFGFIRMAILTDQATVKFQNEVGFPFLQGLPSVIRALERARFLWRAQRAGHCSARSSGRPTRKPSQGAALEAALAQHGLTLAEERDGEIATKTRQAPQRKIGFPVALKIVSSAICAQDRGRRRAVASVVGSRGCARGAGTCRVRRQSGARRADRRLSRAGDGRWRRDDCRRAHRSSLRSDAGGRRRRHPGRTGQGRRVPAAAGHAGRMRAR